MNSTRESVDTRPFDSVARPANPLFPIPFPSATPACLFLPCMSSPRPLSLLTSRREHVFALIPVIFAMRKSILSRPSSMLIATQPIPSRRQLHRSRTRAWLANCIRNGSLGLNCTGKYYRRHIFLSFFPSVQSWRSVCSLPRFDSCFVHSQRAFCIRKLTRPPDAPRPKTIVSVRVGYLH